MAARIMTVVLLGCSGLLNGCYKPLDLTAIPMDGLPDKEHHDCVVCTSFTADVKNFEFMWGCRLDTALGDWAQAVGERVFAQCVPASDSNHPSNSAARLALSDFAKYRAKQGLGAAWSDVEDRIAGKWQFSDPTGRVLLETTVDEGATSKMGHILTSMDRNDNARFIEAIQNFCAKSVEVLAESPEVYRYALLKDLYVTAEGELEEAARKRLQSASDAEKAAVLNALLYFAIEYGTPSLYAFCRTQGADPSVLGRFEIRKPIHVAAACGNLDALSDISAISSELEAECQWGHTALFYAVFTNHLDAGRLLVSKGAQPLIRCDENSRMEGDMNYAIGDHLLSAGVREQASAALGHAQEAYTECLEEIEAELKSIRGKEIRNVLLASFATGLMAYGAQMQANYNAHAMAELSALRNANTTPEYYALRSTWQNGGTGVGYGHAQYPVLDGSSQPLEAQKALAKAARTHCEEQLRLIAEKLK